MDKSPKAVALKYEGEKDKAPKIIAKGRDNIAEKIIDIAKDQVEVFNRLGVSAQIVPQAELYLSLKTKVIDCSLYAPAAVKSISLQEVSKFASMIYLFSSPFSSIGVSQKAWANLPDDLKKIVRDENDQLLKRSTEKYMSASYTAANNKFFEENGARFWIVPNALRPPRRGSLLK